MSAQAPPLLTRLSGLVLGLVLPLAMFTANRSAALMLSLAALLAAGGVAQAGRLGAAFAPLTRPWPWPARLGAAFVALAILSLVWTHNSRAGAFSLGEFLLPLAAAMLLGLSYRICRPPQLGLTLALGIGLAASAAIADLATGMVYRHRMGIRTDTYVLNRSVVSNLLLVAPMLWLLAARARWLAPLGLVPMAIAIAMSESGAAKLGLLAGVTTFVLASLWPRLALWATMGGGALLLAISPWIGLIARWLIPARLHEAMAAAHSGDRVDIWLSFGAAAMERPWLGSGLGASTRMAADPMVNEVAEPLRRMLGAGHPHNAFLQIWVELGALGAALAAGLLMTGACAMLRFGGARLRHATVLAAIVLSIGAVSHGAWQAWWLASAGAAVALFVAMKGERDERL